MDSPDKITKINLLSRVKSSRNLGSGIGERETKGVSLCVGDIHLNNPCLTHIIFGVLSSDSGKAKLVPSSEFVRHVEKTWHKGLINYHSNSQQHVSSPQNLCFFSCLPLIIFDGDSPETAGAELHFVW